MFTATQRFALLLIVVAVGVVLVFAGNLTGTELWAFLTGTVIGAAGASAGLTRPTS